MEDIISITFPLPFTISRVRITGNDNINFIENYKIEEISMNFAKIKISYFTRRASNRRGRNYIF